MKRISTYAATLVTVGMVLAPSLALAVLPVPTVPVSGRQLTGSGVTTIINDVVGYLMTISVVIGVGYFVYGAILYFVKGDPKDGATKMKNSVFGIALILAVGLILQTISGLIARGLNVG